jgi:hypothetical protein
VDPNAREDVELPSGSIAREVAEPTVAWPSSRLPPRSLSHTRSSRSPPDPPYHSSISKPGPIFTRSKAQERGGPTTALFGGLIGLFQRPPPTAARWTGEGAGAAVAARAGSAPSRLRMTRG